MYFVPAFVGLGAPHWDMYARGLLIGLTSAARRARTWRARRSRASPIRRATWSRRWRAAGQPIDVLRVDGGGTANRFLMQFQADVLGVPVEVAAIQETTALGAAYLAGLAVGVWKSPDELRKKRAIAARYEPNMAPDQRADLYAGWQRAVDRSRGWAAPA